MTLFLIFYISITEQVLHVRHLRRVPLLDRAKTPLDRLPALAALAPVIRGKFEGPVEERLEL